MFYVFTIDIYYFVGDFVHLCFAYYYSCVLKNEIKYKYVNLFIPNER